MIVQMQILLREDFVPNNIQLMDDFDLRAFLNRWLWAVGSIGNVCELSRLGNCHVVNAIEEFETVHDATEELVRVGFEKFGIQNVFQSAVQANVCFILNVLKILVIAVENEDQWGEDFMHPLSIANRGKLTRVAEQNIDHNLLNFSFAIEVNVRICSDHILPYEIAQFRVSEMLIPERIFGLR